MRCVRFVRLPFVRLAFVPWLLAVHAAPATAEDISGTIATTKTIVEDSRLVGDVTCTTTTTPCLQFGAPNITLHLNGFMVTGPANPDDTTTCNPTSGPPFSDGISNGTSAATSQAGVRVIGPGMVQKFRRHGLFIVGAPGVATNVTVRNLTSHANCFSGLLTNGMTNSVLDGIVSIRNAANSGGAPCGGNCLVNSNNNRIVNGLFGGNGSVCAAALCAAPPTITSNNDFGMGLIAGSAGNVVEGNSLTGNTNGLLIQAGASGNTIRGNIAVGKPAEPALANVRPHRVRHQGRSHYQWCPQHVREKLVYLVFGPGTVALPEFPGSDRAHDLSGGRDTERSVATEWSISAGDDRRHRVGRPRSDPRLSDHQRHQ